MTTDAETVVRRAYRAAEGNVMDVPGFIDLFADDGVVHAGQKSFRGEDLSYVVVFMGKLPPDVHRELHRGHVMGNVVAVELSIRGTFSGTFESAAGVIQPNGAKLEVPGAEFWYVENGKIKEFNCYFSVSIMLEQMGIQADFASAVGAQAVTSAAVQEAKDKAPKEELAKFVADRHEEPQWPRERLYRTGYLRAGRRHAPHLSYLKRTDQAPGEVRDRRGVEVGTRGVEAREEVTVKADPVGSPNHPLQQTGGA